MIGVGLFLRQARQKQGLSILRLSRETKIRESFLEAIEKENWKILPEFPVVQGFVKNMVAFLGEDEKKVLALLRRDYPPREQPLVPKLDLASRFIWTPRRTFGVGVLIILVLVSTYLGFQYYRFLKSPSLEISSPQEGQIVESQQLMIKGQAEQDASVVVNNQPLVVDKDGNFGAEIEVNSDTKEVLAVATSRSGKQTIVRRTIIVRIK